MKLNRDDDGSNRDIRLQRMELLSIVMDSVKAACSYCLKLDKQRLQNTPRFAGYAVTLKAPMAVLCTIEFSIQKIYVLPAHCIYMLCTDLRANSGYFPTH